MRKVLECFTVLDPAYVSSLHGFLLCSSDVLLKCALSKEADCLLPGESNKGEGLMPA